MDTLSVGRREGLGFVMYKEAEPRTVMHGQPHISTTASLR